MAVAAIEKRAAPVSSAPANPGPVAATPQGPASAAQLEHSAGVTVTRAGEVGIVMAVTARRAAVARRHHRQAAHGGQPEAQRIKCFQNRFDIGEFRTHIDLAQGRENMTTDVEILKRHGTHPYSMRQG